MPFLVLLTGCFSNWGGEPFPNRYESTPHWRDCDGDGWGDGTVDPTCRDIDASDQPPEACADGKWVQNGLDCDDAFAGSGALVGMACPLDYSEQITQVAYSVVALGGREYLLWEGQPEHVLAAQDICESWWTNPLRIANEDFNLEEGEEPGGLLSLSGERTNLVPQVVNFMTDNNLTTWSVWVDARLENAADPDSGWVWGGLEPEAINPDDWCDGPPDPQDIFPLFTEWSEQESPAVQMFTNTRLVLQFQSSGDFCLAAPNDPILGCYDGENCNKYDLICERKFFEPNCQQPADGYDPTCLNILTLSDFTCTDGG